MQLDKSTPRPCVHRGSTVTGCSAPDVYSLGFDFVFLTAQKTEGERLVGPTGILVTLMWIYNFTFSPDRS